METARRVRSIGKYHVEKTIGRGTFGKVKYGTHTITGQPVAIKILEKRKIRDDADYERVKREITILKEVRHPHVIELFEIIETTDQLFLVMDYAGGGELFDYIVQKGRLDENEACRFFCQIVSAVDAIHKLNVVHRDLKPENILLDENKNIKIVDFGLSNLYSKGSFLETACGSPCYAAPEMIQGKPYNPAGIDIWSCGVILFAMVCGYLPFEEEDTNKLWNRIIHADFTFPQGLSKPLQDMIYQLLTPDPTERITIQRIRFHSWFLHFSGNKTTNDSFTSCQLEDCRCCREWEKYRICIQDELLHKINEYGITRSDIQGAISKKLYNTAWATYRLMSLKCYRDILFHQELVTAYQTFRSCPKAKFVDERRCGPSARQGKQHSVPPSTGRKSLDSKHQNQRNMALTERKRESNVYAKINKTSQSRPLDASPRLVSMQRQREIKSAYRANLHVKPEYKCREASATPRIQERLQGSDTFRRQHNKISKSPRMTQRNGAVPHTNRTARGANITYRQSPRLPTPSRSGVATDRPHQSRKIEKPSGDTSARNVYTYKTRDRAQVPYNKATRQRHPGVSPRIRSFRSNSSAVKSNGHGDQSAKQRGKRCDSVEGEKQSNTISFPKPKRSSYASTKNKSNLHNGIPGHVIQRTPRIECSKACRDVYYRR